MSREQKTPIGSRWQLKDDSRVFVVIERKPFGNMVIKQEGRAYFGYPKQQELLTRWTLLPKLESKPA